MLSLSLGLLLIPSFALAASRTEPPEGSIIVRADTTTSGEYATLSDAIASLSDGAEASIFIYPGTYSEQVYIDRSGSLKVKPLFRSNTRF
jgi:pectinesterase